VAAADHAVALGNLLDRFAALYRPPAPLIAALHGQVERLAAIRSPIPAVFQHGDPGVQNLIVGPDGRVSFIDWENAEDRGAPFWDLLVFLRAYAVWSSRRRRLRSRLGAAVEHFVDGSTLSPFILDAMAEYRRAVAVPSEAVEPLFFMAWVYQAVNEAPRLQRDRLADGQFVRFLDALVQRRDAPLLRRLLGAVEA
jgi:aminoglycoside phosphotransferase (APT) family kinase protein